MPSASLYVFAYLLMNLTQQTMWYCAFTIPPEEVPQAVDAANACPVNAIRTEA